MKILKSKWLYLGIFFAFWTGIVGYFFANYSLRTPVIFQNPVQRRYITPVPSKHTKSAHKTAPTAATIKKGITHALNPIPGQYEHIRSRVLARVRAEFGDNENIEAIDNIITHESHYNPLAANGDSGACGIFQAYPCSKLPCRLEDVDCQIEWGLQYIKNRYKTPQLAWNYWQANNSY